MARTSASRRHPDGGDEDTVRGRILEAAFAAFMKSGYDANSPLEIASRARGSKGQRSRAGSRMRPGFEGGQMPLIRRVPKRGFTNPFRVPAQVVNMRDLARLPGEEVNPGTLVAAGLVSRADDPVKLLGTGDVARAYVVRGCALSASARTKIEQAGGRVEE